MHYRIITRPQPEEYAAYYHNYIAQLPQETSILHRMEKQISDLREMVQNCDTKKANYRYAKRKWSLAEVVAHIIDSERIFATRALVFSRNDQTEYPGFEQDDYVKESNTENRTLQKMLDEFEHLRRGNILMFQGMSDEMFLRSGIANKNRMTVRATVYIIAGHVQHHMQIIRERYL